MQNKAASNTVWANGKLRVLTTGECNLSCHYCHNEGQPKNRRYFDSRLLKAIASWSERAEDYPTHVTFSGGEALLHPGITDMVRVAATDLRSEVALVTNGILLNECAIRDLGNAGLSKVRLGIDSLNPFKPRPSKGLLADAYQVDQIIHTCKAAGLTVELNCVLSRFNKPSFLNVLRLAINHQVPVKFFELVEVEDFSSMVSSGRISPTPALPYSEFAALVGGEHPGATFAPALTYGDANMTGIVGGIEVRYCRYLCPFGLCWTTGTRVDSSNYVFTCMSNRREITSRDSIGASLRALDQRCIRNNIGAKA